MRTMYADDMEDNMTTKPKEVWQFLEGGYLKDLAPKTETLYLWSLNFDDVRTNPFWLFLDLIGWSQEKYGRRMSDPDTTLAYLEADLVALALTEWANEPRNVEEWLTALMECYDA